MLDLVVETNNELNLNPSEKRLFCLSLGEVISKFFQDKTNLADFQKEEENLKKEVKSLEAKRDSRTKEQKG